MVKILVREIFITKYMKQKSSSGTVSLEEFCLDDNSRSPPRNYAVWKIVGVLGNKSNFSRLCYKLVEIHPFA